MTRTTPPTPVPDNAPDTTNAPQPWTGFDSLMDGLNPAFTAVTLSTRDPADQETMAMAWKTIQNHTATVKRLGAMREAPDQHSLTQYLEQDEKRELLEKLLDDIPESACPPEAAELLERPGSTRERNKLQHLLLIVMTAAYAYNHDAADHSISEMTKDAQLKGWEVVGTSTLRKHLKEAAERDEGKSIRPSRT